MHTQRKFILIAVSVGLITGFLPWIGVNLLFGNHTTFNAFSGSGYWYMIFMLTVGLFMLSGDRTQALQKDRQQAVVAVAVLAIYCALVYITNPISALAQVTEYESERFHWSRMSPKFGFFWLLLYPGRLC